MNRLEYISQIDPIWAITIYEFMNDYPEFCKYNSLIPLHSRESIPYKNVSTLFQGVMHYICATGVRYSYAIKQWELIYPFINTDSWETIVENATALETNPTIQPKKRAIYSELIHFMNDHGLNHHTIRTLHLSLLQKNISGIGVGCVAWCKKYFTFDDDCIEYTDIHFKKGFQLLYNTDSIRLRKEKANEWQQKKVGRIASLMVLQIGGYSL